MSLALSTWVWQYSPYDGTKLLIHLALSDWAGDDGHCWPSQPRIAQKCRCTVETVRTTIRDMEEDGLIKIVEPSRGRGHSHRYQLQTPKRFGPYLENPQIQRETPKSDGINPQISRHKPPNPSPKNHQEQSINHQQNQQPLRCLYCREKITVGKKHYCTAMNQSF